MTAQAEPAWEVGKIETELQGEEYLFLVTLTRGGVEAAQFATWAAGLIDYGAFQAAALSRLGRLVWIAAVEAAEDRRRAWLDLLRERLPEPPKPVTLLETGLAPPAEPGQLDSFPDD